MSDIAASERRLSTALDRIDQLLDAERPQSAQRAADPELLADFEAAQTEIQRLQAELEKLHNRQDEESGGSSDDSDTVKLAAENEKLEAANRTLTAELEALKSTREAEIAQLGEVTAELERLLSAPAGQAPVSPEVTGDDGGIPEEPEPQGKQGAFSGIYGDVSGDDDADEAEDR